MYTFNLGNKKKVGLYFKQTDLKSLRKTTPTGTYLLEVHLPRVRGRNLVCNYGKLSLFIVNSVIPTLLLKG